MGADEPLDPEAHMVQRLLAYRDNPVMQRLLAALATYYEATRLATDLQALHSHLSVVTPL